jgi:DNA-binding response OmpR family regulator
MDDRKVLIVDDSLELGRLIRSALDTLNIPIEVAIVPSAEEAILEAARRNIDLLICDIRLPGLSGLELISRLRMRKKVDHVIQITALNDPEMRRRAEEAGADAFFFKPLPMAEFLDTVSSFLGLEKPQGTEHAAEPEEDFPRLSSLLDDLRSTLAAHAVMLVDRDGRSLAMSGDLPDPGLGKGMAQALAAVMGTGRQAANALGGGEAIFTIKGVKYDLLATPIGTTHSLLLVMPSTSRSVRLWIASDEVLTARPAIFKVLERSGMTAAPASQSPSTGATRPAPEVEYPETAGVEGQPEESASPVVDASPEELASMFEHESKPGTDELNAYWESAAQGEESRHTPPPGMLSYDQARRLGLTPEDEHNVEGDESAAE